jgi:hypothetical protein
MQIRITDKRVQEALKASAKKDGRSFPKQNEYLLKIALNLFQPQGLSKR